jgi:hypothetical protein
MHMNSKKRASRRIVMIVIRNYLLDASFNMNKFIIRD